MGAAAFALAACTHCLLQAACTSIKAVAGALLCITHTVRAVQDPWRLRVTRVCNVRPAPCVLLRLERAWPSLLHGRLAAMAGSYAAEGVHPATPSPSFHTDITSCASSAPALDDACGLARFDRGAQLAEPVVAGCRTKAAELSWSWARGTGTCWTALKSLLTHGSTCWRMLWNDCKTCLRHR